MIAVVRQMPAKQHWPDKAKPFKVEDSRAVQWLVRQPEVLEWLFQEMRSAELIGYDEETREWSGQEKPTAKEEGNGYMKAWPEKGLVMEMLGGGALSFTEWRDRLKLGHWRMVHLTKHLEKSGEIVRLRDGTYRADTGIFKDGRKVPFEDTTKAKKGGKIKTVDALAVEEGTKLKKEDWPVSELARKFLAFFPDHEGRGETIKEITARAMKAMPGVTEADLEEALVPLDVHSIVAFEHYEPSGWYAEKAGEPAADVIEV